MLKNEPCIKIPEAGTKKNTGHTLHTTETQKYCTALLNQRNRLLDFIHRPDF
jgi:hypothetical protein